MLQATTENIANHLAVLVGERNPHSAPDRLHQAGDYIAAQFRAMGLSVREEPVPFDTPGNRNILGCKQGPQDRSADFILAAHYDTVESTPGADDNASAVAALLEIAHCLRDSPLQHPLTFAAFTLEEYGFVGSTHFVNQARKQHGAFKGMISLEMVGFTDFKPGSQQYPFYVDPAQYPDRGDFIAVVGNQPSTDLTHSLVQGMRHSAASLPVESLVVPGRGDEFPEVRLSDHTPFWENDVPAVMVTDTAFFRNPNYHRPTDTLETLDLGFIRNIAQGIAGFLKSYLA